MSEVSNKWQLLCDSSKERNIKFLESGVLSDCTLIVGTGDNVTAHKGHKVILAGASPVFASMLSEKAPEVVDVIRLPDVELDMFKLMMEYIYKDEIKIESVEIARKLSRLAHRYMFNPLYKASIRYLENNLNADNALHTYEYARLYKVNELMEKSMRLIRLCASYILKYCSFVDIELETLILIFQQGCLNIDSEILLFKAAERYYKERHRNGKILSIDESTTPALYMRDVVKHIRFLTLSAAQFTEISAKSDILTQTDKSTILIALSLNKQDIAIPPEFTSSSLQREGRMLPPPSLVRLK